MMNKTAVIVLLWVAIILLGAVVAYPIQLLWNYALVGSIVGVNKIGFWQAYGIFLLIRIMIYNGNINNSTGDKTDKQLK
jgi:hypothetical protein